jgi:hypothetical protein
MREREGVARRGGCAGASALHTFSIALLVGSPFHPLLAFLTLGVDAFLGYAVLDTAETGTGVVTLLARLLAVCAGVLDLPALGSGRLSRHETWWERIHVHGDARVLEGMHGHGRLDGIGRRL